MLIPSDERAFRLFGASLSRRVNANSQLAGDGETGKLKLIKKGEC